MISQRSALINVPNRHSSRDDVCFSSAQSGSHVMCASVHVPAAIVRLKCCLTIVSVTLTCRSHARGRSAEALPSLAEFSEFGPDWPKLDRG